MTYDGIVRNACAMLEDNGVQFDGEGLPRVFMEQELVDMMNMYIGACEAAEVERLLVIADMNE